MAVIIKLDQERDGSNHTNALTVLTDLVQQDLTAVNTLILHEMQSPVNLIPQLASHVIAAGGKRLRPLLTLAASKLCGYQGKNHIDLATAVEFIHTATLLHDDVIDESLMRRGQQSANSLWGNQASVLVGDFLFSRAFQLMVKVGSLKILDILSKASALIAEGEVLQLINNNNTECTEQAYLDVVRAKTAILFSAACEVGSILAERPKIEQDGLASFGLNLGIVFQLVDDVLDYSAQNIKFGKSVGNDFQEGKITLPIILAYRRGSEKEREFWRRVLEQQEQKEGDFDYALSLLHQHHALKDSIIRAKYYADIAHDSLDAFKDSIEKKSLLNIIHFCLNRTY
ncbi:MAG: polyprenyl synthetase family protein [Alphaproteobacteria bacterium]|nr:polyprenyl synthetase family protein [Alphaproteobacteria bacterium]